MALYLEKGTFGIFPAQLCKGLTPLKQIILCWLWFHSNQEGECFPSCSKLAEECGATTRAIQQNISCLCDMNLVHKVNRKREDGSCTSNLYKVTVGVEPYSGGSELGSLGGGERGSGGRVNEVRPINQNQIEPKPDINQNHYILDGIQNDDIKSVSVKNEYSQDFETFWSFYPNRPGDNKSAAWRCWQARINEGIKHLEMIDGAKRYQAHCNNEGKTGSSFVKMSSTFIGPCKHFKDTYEVTSNARKKSESEQWDEAFASTKARMEAKLDAKFG